MPYTPPPGNEIDFQFGAGGYVAPAGNEIDFQFGGGAPDNLARLDLLWETDAPQLPVARLDLQWSTDARAEATASLELQWLTAAPADLTGRLDIEWETEPADFAPGLLELQWATDAPADSIGFLHLQWATIVGVGTGVLDVQWETLVTTERTGVLDLQWETEGAPSATARLDLQWETVGATASTGQLDLQWETLGVTEAEGILDFEWQTLTPMDATALLDIEWAWLQYVDADCVIAMQDEIDAAVTLDSSGLSEVAQAVDIDSAMVSEVAQAVVLTSSLGDVEQSIDIDAPILETVAQSCELGSPLLEDVAQAVTLDAEIKDMDDVAAAVTIVAPILGDSQVIVATQQMLTINGQSIPLADVDISIDEGQFAWTCEASLLDVRHYALFSANDTFTVDLGGETYTFLVESKRMARELGADGEPRIQASISGTSPTAQYASPRAKRVTKTWDTAVVASSVAAELLPGVAIDWRIIDWSIPAFRVAAENESPIEIISRIVQAAGGLLETNPDGSLYVRYRYPVPVADYASMVPDQVYTDTADRFSVSEGFSAVELVNRLRIMDVVPGAYADVIEFEQDRLIPSQGKLRIYPSPWRETFELTHTSLPIVSVERLGVDTAEHTETVEVLRGEGSVQYPIDAVLSLEWLYTNLGGITFEPDQRTFKSTSTTATESLLRITYRTRFVDYRAVAFDNAEVQFLVKEPEIG